MCVKGLFNKIGTTRILLIGESHDYIGDTPFVLSLIEWFRTVGGRQITFFMEHFPGEEVNQALEKLVQYPAGGVVNAVEAFLHMQIPLPNKKGMTTPLDSWGNYEQTDKLRAILGYAVLREIPIVGHDLPHVLQTRAKKLIKMLRTSAGKEERLEVWAAVRDVEMIERCVEWWQKNQNSPSAMLCCFVGAKHLVQKAQLAIRTGQRVEAIQPQPCLYENKFFLNTPVSPTKAVVKLVEGTYQFGPPTPKITGLIDLVDVDGPGDLVISDGTSDNFLDDI